MKNFIKRNWVSIICCSALILWILYEILYYFDYHYYGLIAYLRYHIGSPRWRNYTIEVDAISLYMEFFYNTSLRYLMVIGQLFVMIPCSWHLYQELRTGYYKNVLTRMSYFNYIKRHIIYALKQSLIIPGCMLFLFLICCIMTSWNFDVYNSIKNVADYSNIMINSQHLDNLLGYMLSCLFCTTSLSITFANIALVYTKFNFKYIVVITASFLSVTALNITTEVLIGIPLQYVTKIRYLVNSLNIFGFWGISDPIISLTFVNSFASILVILSSLVVSLLYRKKEGVIIENES